MPSKSASLFSRPGFPPMPKTTLTLLCHSLLLTTKIMTKQMHNHIQSQHHLIAALSLKMLRATNVTPSLMVSHIFPSVHLGQLKRLPIQHTLGRAPELPLLG